MPDRDKVIWYDLGSYIIASPGELWTLYRKVSRKAASIVRVGKIAVWTKASYMCSRVIVS
jgi:hypothetical protein